MNTDSKPTHEDGRRREDARLLRGRGQFIADISSVAGLREAAILRSTYAHAIVKAISVDLALKSPGVLGVLTGADAVALGAPLGVAAPVPQDYFPIAVGKVRYVGEPVAVVVAETRAQAEDAAELIEVSYEPLPAVVDEEDAVRDGATILHDELGSNVAVDRLLSYGDPDEAFRQADLIVSGRYHYPKVSSTPIETYGVVAHWTDSDSISIWTNFQGPFSMHPVMARALRVSSSQLRLIVPPDIGGGFGIKISIYPYAVLIGLAARKFGVPVRWIEDRLEALAASSSGTARTTDIEAAVAASGEVLAWRMRLLDNVGAYIRAPEPGCLFRSVGNLTSAYRTKHLEVRAIAAMTNTCPTGPNRGYGVSQLYFAMERMMDKIAAELGIDPMEVRRRNLVQPEEMPYTTPSGGMYDSGDYPAGLQELVDISQYDQLRAEQAEARKAGRLVGIGIALGIDPSVSNMGYIDIVLPANERRPGRTKSGAGQEASVQIDASGGMTIILSTCAQGQGHETVAAQIAANVLGIEASNIQVVAGMDTATRGWTVASGAYSSRFAATGAVAVHKATSILVDKLKEIAAHLFESDVEDVVFEEGQAHVNGVPSQVLTIRELAGIAHWDHANLPPGMEPGLSTTSYVTLDTLTSVDELDRVNSSGCYGFVADLVGIEIDPITLEVQITRYVTVHDVGKILHRGIVEGQIYGATLHGLGAALFEEMKYGSDGSLMTGTLMDYLIPTAAEAPQLLISHMESPSPVAGLGAKGVGESSTETAPAAIANAVADALGVDINRLPITPSQILEFLGSDSISYQLGGR
jgi:2-furoyl-CoA dehydrogenase large subunit